MVSVMFEDFSMKFPFCKVSKSHYITGVWATVFCFTNVMANIAITTALKMFFMV
jgi:hypothetical protein